jgi:hypothetical protein
MNVFEVNLLFAPLYEIVAARRCGGEQTRMFEGIAYSFGRFFTIDIPYAADSCPAEQVSLHEVGTVQLMCEFVLVVFALASIINMLSVGQESISR